jgi:hypothetical protein
LPRSYTRASQVSRILSFGENAIVSKTQFVGYSGQGFWAYDLALGIFLKHLIDAAEASDYAGTPWLSSAISNWRIVACISDFCLDFDLTLPEVERQVFITMAEDACTKLSQRASIPAEEIAAWTILDDLRIFPRGATEVSTAPIVELGEAIVALISGTLPEAPGGTLWFYGVPNGRTTIAAALPRKPIA